MATDGEQVLRWDSQIDPTVAGPPRRFEELQRSHRRYTGPGASDLERREWARFLERYMAWSWQQVIEAGR